LVVGCAIALVAISTRFAFAQGSVINGPTNIINQYRSVETAWLTTAAGYANRLFGILAVIEFAWTGVILALDKTDLQGWTSTLIRRMMFIGAFFALLQFGTTWIPSIIDSFVTVGQVASGVSSLSPSAILARGLEITGDLLVGAAQSGWLAAFGTALCMVFAALLGFLAFLGLSIQFVVATIESYLVIGAGFLFLGFGGSRWTAPYVERYIAYAVSTGVKIMLIYLLIGAGYILSGSWVAAAQNIANSTQPATDALDIAASAVILLMICWNAPKLAAAVLGGAPALTGGDALATGGALLGGAVTLAGLTAGGVALGAKMLAARGGAMAVSQAANMGAGGGTGSNDMGGFAGGGSGGGGNGGSGGARVSPGRTGSATGDWGTRGAQPSPPSSGANAAASPTDSGNRTSEQASSKTPPTNSALVPGPNPIAGGSSTNQSVRRADIADAAARATFRGGVALQQLRGAIPSDAAPHVSPPPLNIETHD
jgi:type IV secretion system protein TrbL